MRRALLSMEFTYTSKVSVSKGVETKDYPSEATSNYTRSLTSLGRFEIILYDRFDVNHDYFFSKLSDDLRESE